jgi:plastocyanin
MSKIITVILVIILGVIAGYYLINHHQVPYLSIPKINQTQTATSTAGLGLTESNETSQTGIPTGGSGNTTKGGLTIDDTKNNTGSIRLTDNGFSPMTITVKINTQVTFTNNSKKNMWITTDQQTLVGFNQQKSVPNGGVYQYTFAKVGTWKYYNHIQPDQSGIVVVTQ